MKIDSSFIGMESARAYESKTTRRFAFKAQIQNAAISSQTEEELSAGEELESKKEGEGESLSDIQSQMMGTGNIIRIPRVDAQQEFSNALKDIRQQSIVYLWRILFGESRGKDLAEKLGIQTEQTAWTSTTTYGMPLMAEPREAKLIELTRTEEVFYSETEKTSFSTTGTVRTADGREISFNLDVGMSRSFSQYTSRQTEMMVMCDPLVINLNSNIATVSDQKFYFDLDADGEEEAISMLCEDSGYLALDLNGDGIVNDGSELFGTSSGDGFADLAKYDEDGNGWIDENDDVWNKLQIWIGQEDGTSRLYRLAEKGVGALCLQNAATDFTQKNDFGEVNAAIRKTGIFLYENGMAGTLQHLDLAVSQVEKLA